MNNNPLTVKFLEDRRACKEGIDFVKRNGLEGLSLDLLDKVKGDVLGGFVSWLKSNKETKVEHDSQGNRTKETYPYGDVYTYEYDSQGNKTKMTYPDGRVHTYEYDSQGNKTKMTYPDGDVTTREYKTLQKN